MFAGSTLFTLIGGDSSYIVNRCLFCQLMFFFCISQHDTVKYRLFRVDFKDYVVVGGVHIELCIFYKDNGQFHLKLGGSNGNDCPW